MWADRTGGVDVDGDSAGLDGADVQRAVMVGLGGADEDSDEGLRAATAAGVTVIDVR